MKKDAKIICNCCGKEMERCGSRYEDYLHIVKNWGYLSEKDGTAEEMDICPKCLERWTQTFAIAPGTYPVTELL